MIDKYKAVILRYEAARQLIIDLKDKRGDLIFQCKSIDHSNFEEHGYTHGELCLVKIWNEYRHDNSDEDLEFHEWLDIAKEVGDCCDSCYESFKIKRGPMADAKKDLGVAKRSISAMGKKLIRDLERVEG